jgi:hypothetical protein
MQLAYALQNTPLSMLENSLVEMENDMAQMTPFDGENSVYVAHGAHDDA